MTRPERSNESDVVALPDVALPAAAPPASERTLRVEELTGCPAAILDSVLAAAVAGFGFTPRERDTLRCLLRGLDNKQIGYKLGCGHKTVETHLTHLLSKARVRSRLELVSFCWMRWAVSHGGSPWGPEPVTDPARSTSGVHRLR